MTSLPDLLTVYRNDTRVAQISEYIGSIIL
jgi:hypothetical protein